MAVLMCLGLALIYLLTMMPTPVVRAQSQQPQSPIETTVAAFLTLSAAKPTLTRTPTAAPTSTPTPTRLRNPTATKPAPPTATKVTPTSTSAPTTTPTPTLTPIHTPTPSETPLVTATPRTLPIVRGYFPLMMKDYPCEVSLPDCFEDNNGFAKAYGPLDIGQVYTATEEIELDRYDFYTVTLTGGARYTFTLTFPRFDVDLYVHGNGPAYAILAKSATEQDGGVEQTVFVPTITAQYYVLVYTYEADGLVNYVLKIE